jgi:two-component system response regulator HydG
MATYPWPGNIRELESVVANGCMMVDTKFIDIKDLPERLRSGFTGDSVIDEGLLSLDEVQRRHVMRVLERVGGNKARAAEVLGLGRATIYQFLSRMKLESKKDVSA